MDFFHFDSNGNYEVSDSILAIVIVFILLVSYNILRLLVGLKQLYELFHIGHPIYLD